MAQDIEVTEEPIKENLNRDSQTFNDRAQWEKLVNYINSEVFDDNSEFISQAENYTVTYQGKIWAKWDNKTQQGKITVIGSVMKESRAVAESSDELAQAFMKMAREKGLNA